MGEVERGRFEPRAENDAGWLSPGRWQGREPPAIEWMVEGCFARGTVAMVSGDGGIGKSILMQQLATAACLGKPWLEMSVAPGFALHLTCEDDADELWRRQARINRHYGCEMADLEDCGMEFLTRVGQDNTLAYLDRKTWRMAPTALYEQVVRRCRDRGHQYVIVDTATQTFAGNQNDEQQVMQYVAMLRRLAMQIQGVVVIVKHPSMAGRALGTGESGSVSWTNSVRSRLYMSENKEGQINLAGMKSNYSRKMEKLPLKWERGAYVIDRPEPAYQSRYD